MMRGGNSDAPVCYAGRLSFAEKNVLMELLAEW
jgi:hypothetical protein